MLTCKFYIPGVHKSDSFCEFLLSWTTSIYCGHVYQYNVCYSPISRQCPIQLFLGDINHSTGVVSGTSVSLGLGGFSLSGESRGYTVVFCISWATGLHFTLFFFNWAGREPKSLLSFSPDTDLIVLPSSHWGQVCKGTGNLQHRWVISITSQNTLLAAIKITNNSS